MIVLTAKAGTVTVKRTLWGDPEAYDINKEQADLNRRAEQLNVPTWQEMYEEKRG